MRWWEGNSDERYWLEATDREDLGADLRAPLVDGSGSENWRYTLFQEAKMGDRVFHYDKRRSAITAVSRIAGPWMPKQVIWAARGSYARERGAIPRELPGYTIPLAGFSLLEVPLTLESLRAARSIIESVYSAIPTDGSRYFPFEVSDRPIRPLQGYAFKLPASFVEAFPELALAADEPESIDRQDESALLQELIELIESASGAYAISGLQRRRSEIRGLKRVAGSIFGLRSRGPNWAFHQGGRDELQFNVGIEVVGRKTAFRTGVAFSLEPSRTLPDPSKLDPKIARFNSWMRENPEAFLDLRMWHWRGNERSEDYAPGPIPAWLLSSPSFIVLGDRQTLPGFDPHRALRTFDRLLPLWEWVEAGTEGAEIGQSLIPSVSGTLRLDGGRNIDGGRWIQATTRERTLNIFLRHAEIQRRLRDSLLAEGFDEVRLEVPIGERAIDVVGRNRGELWFFEVKTGRSDRDCLRQAIGQLLEYALWPGATRPERLVVVGEPQLTAEGLRYIAILNEAFPVPIAYRQLALEDPPQG